jgi:hypothetical protein
MESQFNIHPLTLAALSIIAPKNDTRHTLNGVHVTRSSGTARATACDGHILATSTWSDEGEDVDLIIPADTVTAALTIHGKNPFLITVAIEDGNHMIGIGRTVFQPIEGSYPDADRVWLPEPAPGTTLDKQAPFAPALVAAIDKLAKRVKGRTPDLYFAERGLAYVIHPGNDDVPSIRGIVMGMRLGEKAGGYPSW